MFGAPACPARPSPQILGPDGAQVLGDSGYIVFPPWGRQEPIIDTLTKHEGVLRASPGCAWRVAGE